MLITLEKDSRTELTLTVCTTQQSLLFSRKKKKSLALRLPLIAVLLLFRGLMVSEDGSARCSVKF